MVKVTILSPIHNEQKSLRELAARVNKVMNKTCGNSWEFLLIDDISTDKSPEILSELEGKYKNIRVITHKKQSGQTGCFKTGFENAKGDIIITIDGDLQLMPEDIPRFIEKMDRGYDLVNAIRENRKHPFWIKLASRVYNTLMLVFFNSPVLDSASNFTAVRSKFVKDLKLRGNDHRYIVPIVVRRGGKRIGEIIVEHKGRSHGKSKYKALPKYIRGFPEIIFAWVRFKAGYFDKKS